jgi:hypothetical protein
MPQKDFQIWLTDKIYLVVDYETIDGRIVSFVVRLMLIQDNHLYNVARYDTAHGTPHRDIMSRSNNILEKNWLTQMEFDSALTYAIDDFNENYANYINAWENQ